MDIRKHTVFGCRDPQDAQQREISIGSRTIHTGRRCEHRGVSTTPSASTRPREFAFVFAAASELRVRMFVCLCVCLFVCVFVFVDC